VYERPDIVYKNETKFIDQKEKRKQYCILAGGGGVGGGGGKVKRKFIQNEYFRKKNMK